MLLVTASLLSVFGFLTWIAGSVLDYHGVAAVGAVVIVGVGAAAMTDGIQRHAGAVETNVSANETQISHEYEPIDTPNQFPLGVIVMLVGSLMAFRSLASIGED